MLFPSIDFAIFLCIVPVVAWTLLITHSGQTQMLLANDWPLESLLAERGAAMAFRITQRYSGITVEGRSRADRCRLESVKPEWFRGERRAETPRLVRSSQPLRRFAP